LQILFCTGFFLPFLLEFFFSCRTTLLRISQLPFITLSQSSNQFL
jgi:hypothetical protein